MNIIQERIPFGIVFVLLALSGCAQYDTPSLKARIVKLESQVQGQEKKIKMLARAATASRTSVFDDPLQQFFGAPEFWEVVYVDKGSCFKTCYEGYKARIRECKGDKACEIKALVDYIKCQEKCDPLIGGGPIP
jgi:hypothetical protein